MYLVGVGKRWPIIILDLPGQGHVCGTDVHSSDVKNLAGIFEDTRGVKIIRMAKSEWEESIGTCRWSCGTHLGTGHPHHHLTMTRNVCGSHQSWVSVKNTQPGHLTDALDSVCEQTLKDTKIPDQTIVWTFTCAAWEMGEDEPENSSSTHSPKNRHYSSWITGSTLDSKASWALPVSRL